MSGFYGKHFAGMYEGSMVGKGAIVFALMGYVISNMKCAWVGEGRAKLVTKGTITLNATVLAAVLGEAVGDVKLGIEVLCSPDPESRTKEEEGRRLVKEGEFEYRVVNAPYYQNLKNKEDEREKSKIRQQHYRERQVVLHGKDAEKFLAAKGKKYARHKKVVQDAGARAGGQEVVSECFNNGLNGN